MIHVESPLDEPDSGNRPHGDGPPDEDQAPVEPARPQPVRDRQKCAHYGELTDLHAEIEADERDEKRALRSRGLSGRWRSRSRESAEGESDHPPPPVDEGKHVVQRGGTTEVAIADSTSREGSEITPSAARLSVIEWRNGEAK